MAASGSVFNAIYDTLAKIKTYLGGDDKENEEPIHDETKDIDADDYNNLVGGLAEVARRTRKGNLICVSFNYDTSVVAGATTILNRENSNAAKSFVAPFGGSIIALAVRTSSAVIGDIATFKLTGKTLEVVLTPGGDDQNNYARQLPGVETFSAGDVLTAEVTTGASYTASCELWLDVYISFGEEEDW